jgi:hypothetical protein
MARAISRANLERLRMQAVSNDTRRAGFVEVRKYDLKELLRDRDIAMGQIDKLKTAIAFLLDDLEMWNDDVVERLGPQRSLKSWSAVQRLKQLIGEE